MLSVGPETVAAAMGIDEYWHVCPWVLVCLSMGIGMSGDGYWRVWRCRGCGLALIDEEGGRAGWSVWGSGALGPFSRPGQLHALSFPFLPRAPGTLLFCLKTSCYLLLVIFFIQV